MTFWLSLLSAVLLLAVIVRAAKVLLMKKSAIEIERSLCEKLESETEKPADSVIYEPTCEALENTPAFSQLRDNCYGGMPIQIGYCNGTNTK